MQTQNLLIGSAAAVWDSMMFQAAYVVWGMSLEVADDVWRMSLWVEQHSPVVAQSAAVAVVNILHYNTNTQLINICSM